MSRSVTATFLSRRTGRAAGCALVALLCVLTTALFALADASASGVAPSGFVRSRAETAFTAKANPDLPSAAVSGRVVSDSDNPFEHGRLPMADAGVPARVLASNRALPTADTAPIGVDRPLPERPPRI
jgi:hypothetical protein